MPSSITLCNQVLQVRQFGNAFILLSSRENESIFPIGQAIYQEQFDFLQEVIATESEICLKLNPHFQKDNLKALENVQLPQSTQGKLHTIPVWFSDSDDWTAINNHSQLTKESFINHFLELEFSVAMFGFLPGFVYLDGLPDQMHIPRKTTPTAEVLPNTLAIGGPYLGIYSLPSPGGWNAIGRIACNIFDSSLDPPMLINQQDRFQFSQVGHSAYIAIGSQQLPITKL